jgi:hypothetical protein
MPEGGDEDEDGAVAGSRRSAREQASLPAVEAAVGVLFVVAVAAAFAFGAPAGGVAQEAQLDAYASDAATVLANEPPSHADSTRLAEVTASEAAFDREAGALERRVDRILPDNLLFRVSTPHGDVGYARPTTVPTGTATVPTGGGAVTIRVWYA